MNDITPQIAQAKSNNLIESLDDFMTWDNLKGTAESFNDCTYILMSTKNEGEFDLDSRRELMFKMQQNQELLLQIKELWPYFKQHLKSIGK